MSTDEREIELKFICDPADAPALLAAAPPGEEDVHDLRSIYYDTDNLALRKAGLSLRIRESAKGRVQTLKLGSGFSRSEIETPLADGAGLDLETIGKRLPAGARDRLQPVFEVRVVRRRRLMRTAEAEIELALDEGEIRAGAAVKSICELELELKAGLPTALFDMAESLGRAAPLYRSFDGKAAQGQALLAGLGQAARRSDKAPVVAAACAAEAFQAIARSALGQLTANGELLRAAPTPEAVHQLRVAGRRLRSAVSVFRAVSGGPEAEAVSAEAAWLAGACGEARALDVLLADALRPARAAAPSHGLDDLIGAAESARERAYGRVAAAAASARYREFVLRAEAWIETGAWLEGDAEVTAQPVAAFAHHALARRRRKLLKAAGHFRRLDDAGRHVVRIQAKKLRYAAEAFAPLFDEGEGRRYISRIKRLQDELGALNDAAELEALFAELPLDGAALFAAGRIAGEAAARNAHGRRKAARAYDALETAAPFW